MVFKAIVMSALLTFASARHFNPELKGGMYGYLEDGEVVRTWTPEQFEEFKISNPLIELLMVVGYGHGPWRPGTLGATSAGESPLGQISQSQAATSVGNGGSFASAGVRPAVADISLSTVSALVSTADPPTTAALIELTTATEATAAPSTEKALLSSSSTTVLPSSSPTVSSTTVLPSSSEATSTNPSSTTSEVTSTTIDPSKVKDDTASTSILLQSISESSYLDIKTDTQSTTTTSTTTEKLFEVEKVEVSEKENEIDGNETVEKVVRETSPPSVVESSSTIIVASTSEAPTNKESDRRPSSSRPGFSSATSLSSASSQVTAEGSALAESPGGTSGTSNSNSNSASVVYGEFAGSVSISSSSSTG